MAKPTYTLNLESQYAKAKLLDKHVCGGAGGGQFAYNLRITAGSLDTNGFVVDNEIVQNLKTLYADREYIASCEQIAGGIIGFVIKNLGAGTKRLLTVECDVFNNTGRVSVAWAKGQVLPAAPELPTAAQVKAVAHKRAEPNYEPQRAC